jgi:hypothetical protein
METIRRALDAVANDRPTPDQIAEWNAADKEMAQRVRAALPGVPLHHAYAVLQAVRVMQRLDAAAAVSAGVAPATDQADDRSLVQHAPGKAVLCTSCRAKGHSVCMAAEAGPANTGQDGGDVLRLSEELCPGFPDRCPNLRTVEPEAGVHLGGVRCGCADEQPAAQQQPKEA